MRARTATRAALAAILLGLTGCLVGPDYERPSVAAPTTAGLAAVSSDSAVRITSETPWARWWEVFEDARLEELVAEARRENQDYKAAIARVHQARALRSEAFAPLVPSIGATGDYSYQQQSANAVAFRPPAATSAAGTPGNPFQLWSGSGDMSYELDLWGRIRRGYEAAQQDELASEEDRKAVEITLVADVVQTYFDVGAAEVEVAITKNALELRLATLDLVKVRHDSGLVSELELRRAEGEVADAAAQVPEAERRHEIAEHRLAVLIGRAPDLRFSGKPPASFEVPPSVPVGIPSALLERRPDIRAAERRLAAATARIGESYANFFPRVTILGRFGYASLNAGTVAEHGAQLWSIGPSIRIPIFEGGRTLAAWHAAQARTDEATALYRQSVLRAFAEVADSISGLEHHSRARDREADAVRAQSRAVDLATADYKDGLTTYLNVLDAQRTLLGSRLAVLRAQRAVLGDLVQLEKALGGGMDAMSPQLAEFFPSAERPCAALPTEILGQAQRRLALVSAVLALAIAVVVATDFALVYALGWRAPHCGMALVAATGAALVLLSLAVFALARSPTFERRTLLDLGLAYEVVGALGIALASYFEDPVALAERTNVWLCLWIVLFPLIVPGTAWKSVMASLLSASMGPLVLLLAIRRGAHLPGAAVLVQTFLPSYLGVLLALIPTRILRGLGATVSHAQRKARELGSYRLVRLLGQGGMGQVWEAEHQRLARPAAIKIVQLEALEGEDERSRKAVLQRFENEARATASLHSPHTVSVYDYGVTAEGTFYYVMELLKGLDLESLVQRFGPLPPARVVRILGQVLDSLAEAHAEGMVHRDIKPANIYLTRLGFQHDFVKVLDFGLVSRAKGCQRADESRLTDANTIVGTPAYMSPEMAEGRRDIDGRADLYALGCLAYWLLTGTQVFDASTRTPMQILLDHMGTAPDAPSLRAGVALPAGLEALVLRLLAKDPADRPASALAVKAQLEALELDDRWSEEHARTWWTHNLRDLAAPVVAVAARATTVVKQLVAA